MPCCLCRVYNVISMSFAADVCLRYWSSIHSVTAAELCCAPITVAFDRTCTNQFSTPKIYSWIPQSFTLNLFFVECVEIAMHPVLAEKSESRKDDSSGTQNILLLVNLFYGKWFYISICDVVFYFFNTSVLYDFTIVRGKHPWCCSLMHVVAISLAVIIPAVIVYVTVIVLIGVIACLIYKKCKRAKPNEVVLEPVSVPNR